MLEHDKRIIAQVTDLILRRQSGSFAIPKRLRRGSLPMCRLRVIWPNNGHHVPATDNEVLAPKPAAGIARVKSAKSNRRQVADGSPSGKPRRS